MKEQIDILVQCFDNINEQHYTLLEKVVKLSSKSEVYRTLKNEMEFLKDIAKYLKNELYLQFKDVKIDQELLDEIHDEILAYDDEDYVSDLPKGYTIHILYSEYVVVYRSYFTLCLIETPCGHYKPIQVNTYSKYKGGEIIKG